VRRSGFTLLELAVVITVIGLVAAAGVTTSLSMTQTARQTATENKMDVIEKALLVYRRMNDRLPCPAAANLETGVEGDCNALAGAVFRATTRAKGVEGAVPYAALGLPKEFMYDGWGRKFAYAVAPEFARPYAFTRIKPQTICESDTALTINDAADNTRSSNAAYALVSYGFNGHGGFLKNGTRMNAGSTNAQEQANCHCNAAAVDSAAYNGTYVQRRAVPLSQITSANYFDDTVRYKERWQMLTDVDTLSDDGYRGPELVIAFGRAAGAGRFYRYRQGCGEWIKMPDLASEPTITTNGTPYTQRGVVRFTSNNQHLLYHGVEGCSLYKIIGANSLVAQTSPVTGCTASTNDSSLDLSNNGYLAISDGALAISFYKQTGDSFSALPQGLSLLQPINSVSFSNNANFLALSTGVIYSRKGDAFVSLGSDPEEMPPSPDRVVFSPDGKMLAATKTDGTIQLWRVSNTSDPVTIDNFMPLPFAPTVNGGNLGAVAFSPDGKYVAFSHDTYPQIQVFNINANYDIVPATVVTTPMPNLTMFGTEIVFSPDSNYMLMRTSDTTTAPVMMFRRTRPDRFEYMTAPNDTNALPLEVLGSSEALSASFAK
jgi:prepilin-type N-terminal cleavage/methylation domain-containing protein